MLHCHFYLGEILLNTIHTWQPANSVPLVVDTCRSHNLCNYVYHVEVDIFQLYNENRLNCHSCFDEILLGTRHSSYVDQVLSNLNIDLCRNLCMILPDLVVGIYLVYNEDMMNCLPPLDIVQLHTIYKLQHWNQLHFSDTYQHHI